MTARSAIAVETSIPQDRRNSCARQGRRVTENATWVEYSSDTGQDRGREVYGTNNQTECQIPDSATLDDGPSSKVIVIVDGQGRR